MRGALGGLETRGRGLLLDVAEQGKRNSGGSSRAKATHEERMLVAVFELGTSWTRECLSGPERKGGGSS